MEGRTVSHYTVLEKLGGGGMGVVYKALDTKLNRHVAIKFLPPELTRDDAARERFTLEAQAASALDHPNICTIYEIDSTSDDQMFIAMGYYEGETLKKRIEHGPLPVEEALDIAIQMAQGLAEAHAANIIHRDVKPANVVLTKNGMVKIVDFGIAKLLGVTGPTQTGTTVGTVAYMAPEQIAGEVADQQCDVWPLGAVLYEMLTGQQAFRGENQWAVFEAIRERDPKPPSSLRADVPPHVQALVLRSLEKRQENRYPSASAFLDAAKPADPDLTRPVGVASTSGGLLESVLKPSVAIPVLVAAAVLAVWGVLTVTRGNSGGEQLLAEVRQLVNQGNYLAAVPLAAEAERRLGASDELDGLFQRMSLAGSLTTDPPGATVAFREYGAGDDAWQPLGLSPLEEVRLPRGIFEWRLELDGHEPRRLAEPNPSVMLGNLATLDPLTIPLQRQGSTPGMVLVPGGAYPVRITGFQPREVLHLEAFLIDRYEVTNREFQEFVDVGGYERAEFWAGMEFKKDGTRLSWAEAMSEFEDSTGRPGPATWAVGNYADGEGAHPVTGVSWYEAVAYANFRGMSLPTFFHWARAAMFAGGAPLTLGHCADPGQQLRWRTAGSGRAIHRSRSIRHVRHGRQRARVDPEYCRRQRESIDSRRGVE